MSIVEGKDLRLSKSLVLSNDRRLHSDSHPSGVIECCQGPGKAEEVTCCDRRLCPDNVSC